MKTPRVMQHLALVLLLTACASQTVDSSTETLTDVGMFYVGGQVAKDATAHSDQALVHYFKTNVAARTPVVLYPGLGLSSYIYISTPDGREGWAQQFAKAGHATYVYDPVGTGPSGFPPSALQGDTPAKLSTWNIDEIWPRWGFGAKRDEPYKNVRFPVEHIDQFYASWPPRLGSALAGGRGAGAASGERGMGEAAGRVAQAGRFRSPKDIAALIALLEKSGPAVLIPHSMGGTTVFAVAAQRPDLVLGIVVIEPVGCPRRAADVQQWQHVPFLAVYGDYVESRGQTGRLNACRATAKLLNEAGGNGAMLELTSEGIFGNTHLLMQDDNSADIAAEIISWITTNVDSERN